MKRTCSMGVGQRFKYKKKDKVPPPGTYNLDSDFKKNNHNRGFSFGMSREVYSNVYVKENPQ